MRKTVIVLLYIFIATCCLAGCGGKSNPPSMNDQNLPQPQTTNNTESKPGLSLLEGQLQYGGEGFTKMGSNSYDYTPSVVEEDGAVYVRWVKQEENKNRGYRSLYISVARDGKWLVKDKKIISTQEAILLRGVPEDSKDPCLVWFALAGKTVLIGYGNFYTIGARPTSYIIQQEYDDTFSKVISSKVIFHKTNTVSVSLKSNQGVALLTRTGTNADQAPVYSIICAGKTTKIIPVNDKYNILEDGIKSSDFFDANNNKLYVGGRQLDVKTGEILFTPDGRDKTINYEFMTANGDRIYVGQIDYPTKQISIEEYYSNMDKTSNQIAFTYKGDKMFDEYPKLILDGNTIHLWDFYIFKKMPSLGSIVFSIDG